MTKKIWINEREYISLAEKKTTFAEEIATRKRSIDFYSLGMYLPNPDPVLKKQGKDITIYKELLSDGHLGGCVSSRKAGVKSLEWGIDRGKAKSRQTRLIEDLFKSLPINDIIDTILDAVFFGYQPIEVMWERAGNYILPKDVVGKPPEWFVFSQENELRFRTKDNYINGEELPDKKFLIPRHCATYQNPYGFPELSRCFWPITFKRGGMKFWVIFTEKYGMPYLIGKKPRGTSKEETDALADVLENMVQDAVAVIPDDSSVEIKEASGKSASADIYERLLEFCKTEVSIAILGQNLTTEVKGGSYAAAQSHMAVRQDIVDSDKKLVANTLNELIRWIFEINFGSGEPPVFSMWEEEDVDLDLAQRDKTLTEAGIRFTKNYFVKAYGLEEDDIEIGAIPQPQPQQFAENRRAPFPDQKALDNAMDGISPETLQNQAEGILKPIIELIKKGESYTDIMENLVETFPDMDASVLEEMLSRAIFVSELWGRLSAEQEA
ncbi:MAG TPA: DUF935 domain-containing protein [Deltaproteobacteria bacterium]|nr:DUF935 domain-containing protein [Deltaproteobacteria bacterium]